MLSYLEIRGADGQGKDAPFVASRCHGSRTAAAAITRTLWNEQRRVIVAFFRRVATPER